MQKLKVWLPTILVVVAAVVNEYLIPYLSGVSPEWSWPAFGVVALTALLNALKRDDNPIKFWDSTLAGIVLAVLGWLILALSQMPVKLDWRSLLVVILPIILGSFSRGLGSSTPQIPSK